MAAGAFAATPNSKITMDLTDYHGLVVCSIFFVRVRPCRPWLRKGSPAGRVVSRKRDSCATAWHGMGRQSRKGRLPKINNFTSLFIALCSLFILQSSFIPFFAPCSLLFALFVICARYIYPISPETVV
jgi:hypothetical protein